MQYVVLTLSGAYRDTAPLAKNPIPSGRRTEFRFDSFLKTVDRILRFRKPVTVVVNCKTDFHSGYVAPLEGIRRELLRLIAAGNHLVFVAQNWAMQEVYLGSACAERIIHPLGSFRFQGVYHSALYFGKLLRELGVRVHPARRGKFKSAPDRLIRNDMTRADGEQYGAYLDTVQRELSGTVVSSLGILPEELDLLLGGTGSFPRSGKGSRVGHGDLYISAASRRSARAKDSAQIRSAAQMRREEDAELQCSFSKERSPTDDPGVAC